MLSRVAPPYSSASCSAPSMLVQQPGTLCALPPTCKHRRQLMQQQVVPCKHGKKRPQLTSGRTGVCKASQASSQILPFGRRILDASVSQANQDGCDTKARQSKLTPHRVFLAICLDRISKEHDNPAFAPSRDGISTNMQIASDLWEALDESHKVAFSDAFRNFCEEMEAVSPGACSDEQLPRLVSNIYAYAQTLAADVRAQVNAVLTAALQLQGISTAQRLGSSEGAASPGSSLVVASGSDVAGTHDADSLFLQSLAGRLGLQSSAVAPSSSSGSSSRPVPGLSMEPDPEVSLVTRIRAQPQQPKNFWSDFMTKARMAWEIFFPPTPVLAPAGAMRSRLQMILVSDRSGLDLPTLVRMKNQSMAALAEQNGWDNLTELHLQVSSQKYTGERITLSLPLTHIPEPCMLRDPKDYDYEFSDDDDNLDHDNYQGSEQGHLLAAGSEAGAAGAAATAVATL